MKIYKIALIVRQYPPEVYEAANKVVEENKLVNDMADFYRVNRDTLAYVVMKLRKMKTFPVDTINKIVEVYKSAKNKNNKMASRIQEKLSKLYNLNIEKEDIAFILKEKGLVNILTKIELQEALSLLDKGKDALEISEILQISNPAITNIKRKYRPDKLGKYRKKEIDTNEIYNKYLSLVNIERKTIDEAYKIIMEEFNLDYQAIYRVLFYRGIRIGSPNKRFKEEEINKMIQLLKEGKTISEIAKEVGRLRQSVYDFLEREYPDLFKKRQKNKTPIILKDIDTNLIKSVLLSINKKETVQTVQTIRNKLNITKEIYYYIKNTFQDNFKEFIIKSIEKDDDTNKILENVKEIYRMDISINAINRIIRENFPEKTLRTEEANKPVPKTNQEDWTRPTYKDPKKVQENTVEIPSFTGETLKMTREEYDEQVRQNQQLTEQGKKRREELKRQEELKREETPISIDAEEDIDAMISRIEKKREQREREERDNNPVASSLNWYKKAKLLNFKNI